MKERRYATRILSHYGMLDGAPPNLERIARVQGVDVRYVPHIEGNASGWFQEDDSHSVISISLDRSKSHQRFVLAHELGHYFLKHGSQPPDTYDQFRLDDYREISANRFAAEILMPKVQVEALLRQGLSQDEMQELFGVSSETMGYRLDNLGFEYDREYVWSF